MSLVLGSTCWIPPLGSFVEGIALPDVFIGHRDMPIKPAGSQAESLGMGRTAWNVHLHPKPSQSHSECAPN